MLYVDDTTGSFSMEDIQCCLSAVSSQRAALVESFAFCIDKELSLKAYLLLQKGLKQEYGISELPQLGIYSEYIQHPESMQYNLPYHVHFSSNIDVEKLKCTIESVIETLKQSGNRPDGFGWFVRCVRKFRLCEINDQ